jgi:hypothetical protein
MVLYFFIIFAKPVYADNFNTQHDNMDNQYYQTIAMGISNYPSLEQILYNKNDVIGENTNNIVSLSKIEDLTVSSSTRTSGKMDAISAPPGTEVDFVYLYHNKTGQDVNISSISLLLSQNEKTSGNLTNILRLPDTLEGSFSYRFAAKDLTRKGIYKTYLGRGLVSNFAEDEYILDRANINNPLLISNTNSKYNSNGELEVNITVKNESNENLLNLKLSYLGKEKVFNLAGNSEYSTSFTLQTIPPELGNISLYNPNIKEECASNTIGNWDYFNSEKNILFASRDGYNISGLLLDANTKDFCVKRIAYTMFSDIIQAPDKSNNDQEEVKGISDIDITKNLTELPKTGQNGNIIIPLLVGGVLLCYSICILRRNYESKTANTRVCTKSRENA